MKNEIILFAKYIMPYGNNLNMNEPNVYYDDFIFFMIFNNFI